MRTPPPFHVPGISWNFLRLIWKITSNCQEYSWDILASSCNNYDAPQELTSKSACCHFSIKYRFRFSITPTSIIRKPIMTSKTGTQRISCLQESDYFWQEFQLATGAFQWADQTHYLKSILLLLLRYCPQVQWTLRHLSLRAACHIPLLPRLWDQNNYGQDIGFMSAFYKYTAHRHSL